MDLKAAIDAFNESSEPKIALLTARDGRVVATLPRVGQEIIVEGSPFNKDVKVTAEGMALLCEEARRAFAPGMELLQVALAALREREREPEPASREDETPG
jgi:hypothetical protein